VDKSKFDQLWASIWDQSDPPPPEGKYQGGGFVQQDKEELWQLARRVSLRSPSNILEIGCAGGGTLLVWQALAPRVVSVDLQGLNGGRGFLSVDHFPSVTFILGDSHHQETLDEVKSMGPYDFLFIDGDHSTEGARMDFYMYAPLVRKGGLIAFHDYNYEPVRKAIDSIDLTKELIIHSHFGIALIEV